MWIVVREVSFSRGFAARWISLGSPTAAARVQKRVTIFGQLLQT